MSAYHVGAVAYDPRVVTIWEGFSRWFRSRGFEVDYTLFSTYEAQVDALFAGRLDAAWNTNLAYVRTLARAKGACRALAMRDTDRDWTSLAVAVTPMGSGVEALRGKRVGFGDSDSPQAWILPAFALRREGLDVDSDLQAERLDRDLGKHGDTGGAERAQLERLRAGELDAAVVSRPTLEALRADGLADGLEPIWISPPYHHCNFTALDQSNADHTQFSALLLAMDEADPELCEPMRLEWVHHFVDGDESGYADLIEAVGRSE